MNRQRICLLILVVFFFSGCTKLKYLNQLLTLKTYSEEQEATDQYVSEHDEMFELLLDEVRSGEVYNRENELSFISTFGEPIYTKTEEVEGRSEKVLLYRKAKMFFGADKVYVYFDNAGKLVKVKYVSSENQ